jgi:hypothetical protein
VLHDALRVSDGSREYDEIENESKADCLSMAISVFNLAGRTDKAAGSNSFYALIRCNALFSVPWHTKPELALAKKRITQP